MREFRIRTCSQGGWPPGRAPGQLRPRCRPLHQTARAHRPCRVHTHSTTGSRLNNPGQLPPSMPVENPAAVNSSVRPRSRKRGCYGLSRLRTGEAAEAPHRVLVLGRNPNPPGGVSIMLQFKAPWATSLEDSLYKFSVNEQQHEAMEDLAGNNSNDVTIGHPSRRPSRWTSHRRYEYCRR